MILGDTFYSITDVQVDMNQNFDYKVFFHAEDQIFKAHFPNQPIVPGACLVQISKEIIENIKKNAIRIVHFNQLKFLNTINPNEIPEVDLNIQFKTDQDKKIALIKCYNGTFTFAKFEFIFDE